MPQNSLKACDVGIEKAKTSLTGKGWSQQKLAKELEVSRQPVDNFFKGKPVNNNIFIRICETLKLDWQEIAGESRSTDSISSLEKASVSANINALGVADQQREEALQNYLSYLSELLVDKQLKQVLHSQKEKPDDEVASTTFTRSIDAEAALNVIKARTLSLLRLLDQDIPRKVSVLSYLNYADLIPKLNLDLEGSNWENANFKRVNLRGVNLGKVNLSNADLRFAKLINADLSNADLSNADLSFARLISADLSNANLSFARLISADLRDADLSFANLSNASLSNVNLKLAVLINAVLINANLKDADLINAYLSNANLLGVNLINAKLNNAKLSRANLNYAKLNNTDLSNANLSNANLSDTNLSGANLQKARYTDNSTSQQTCELYCGNCPCPTIFPPNFDPIAAGMVLVK